MKLPGFHLIVILLLAFGLAANGQEPAEAVLVDEFGDLPCDDWLARLDHFYTELQRNPTSRGFVVIANSPDKRRESVFRKRMIEKYTRFRGFDLNRINIVRTSDRHEVKVSFWRLPAGASEPQVEEDELYEIPKTVKEPFMFAAEELFGHVECSEFDVEIFGQFLRANPSARANLVFREKSAKVGRRRANQVVSALVGNFGIARNRIRVFIVEPRLNAWEPIAEFWYLP